MNKEEQIKDIIKDLDELWDKPITTVNVAEYLISKGYQKINGNEVVISKEKLKHKEINYKIGLGKSQSWVKKLKNDKEQLESENFNLQRTIEKNSEETAKEIFSLLLSDEYICYFDVAVVKEIAEKYGVEI